MSYDEIVKKVARPGMANGAKGFFHLTVIGVGSDVDEGREANASRFFWLTPHMHAVLGRT